MGEMPNALARVEMVLGDTPRRDARVAVSIICSVVMVFVGRLAGGFWGYRSRLIWRVCWITNRGGFHLFPPPGGLKPAQGKHFRFWEFWKFLEVINLWRGLLLPLTSRILH